MKFKKVLACMLSAMIMFQSAVPAFATEETVVQAETETEEGSEEDEAMVSEEEDAEEEIAESEEKIEEESSEDSTKEIMESVENSEDESIENTTEEAAVDEVVSEELEETDTPPEEVVDENTDQKETNIPIDENQMEKQEPDMLYASDKENIEVEDSTNANISEVVITENIVKKESYNTTIANEEGVIASGGASYSYTWTIYDDGLLVFDSNGTDISDYSLGTAPWYAYRDYIKKIVMYRIDNIGDYAFYGLNKLEEIDIVDEQLQRIGVSAFENCSMLKSIYIQGDYHSTTIEMCAFSGCTSLEEVSFPSNVSIKERAFEYCSNLKTVYINSIDNGSTNFYYIGTELASDCFIDLNLTVYYPGGASLAAGVEGNYGGTVEWKAVNYGTCGKDVFWNYENNVLNISGNGSIASYDVGQKTPYYCYNDEIKKIVINEGVLKLPDYCFEYFDAVEYVEFSDGVESIAQGAFQFCIFKDLLIPKSVKTFKIRFDDLGFSNVKTLTDIYYLGDQSDWESIEGSAVIQNFYNIHFLTYNEKVDAGCTYEGIESYYYGFGEDSPYQYYLDENKNPINGPISIPATGHIYEWIVDEEPTTEMNGLKHEECIGCGIKQKENTVIEKLSSENLPSGTCGSNITWALDNSGILTISGTGEIPAGTYFNDYQKNIKEVIIDENITSIPDGMFKNCVNLVSISIPDSVISIGSNTFKNCSDTLLFKCIKNSYTHIYAQQNNLNYEVVRKTVATGNCGDNITWILDNEGTITFSGTGEMTGYSSYSEYEENIIEVIINKGITRICDDAFNGCYNLTSVSLPTGLKYIGTRSFYLCENLNNITIPYGVLSIGSLAFGRCLKIQTIDIPATVSSLGSYAFDTCTALETVNLPESINEIYAGAFYNCTKLQEIIVPKNVKVLDEKLFSGCTNLTDVTILGKITSVKSEAFKNCTSLKEIELPDTINSIYSSAFENCSSLKSIKIPKGIQRLESNLFYNCNNLESVILPQGLTEISSCVFEKCNNLKNINIPDGLTSFCGSAFIGCGNLTELYFPRSISSISNVYSINNYSVNTIIKCYENTYAYNTFVDAGVKFTLLDEVFSGSCGENANWTLDENGKLSITGTGAIETKLSNLPIDKEKITELYIGEGITSICHNAFEQTAIDKVSFPSTLEEIGSCAFYDNDNLKEIFINSDAISIYSNAFVNCDNLSTVSIENIIYLGYEVFVDCINLISVSLSIKEPNDILDSVSLTRTFVNCYNLKNVTISGYIPYFELTFASCRALEEIELPVGTECLNDTFHDCQQLKRVILPETTTGIIGCTFSDCNNLEEIVIPNSVIIIDEKNVVFGKCPEQFTFICYENSYAHQYALENDINFEFIEDAENGIFENGIAWSLTENGTLSITGTGCMPDGPIFSKIKDSIKNVYITDGITAIGNQNFENCKNLINIELPGSLNTIGEKAFSGSGIFELPSLTAIKRIGAYAFSECNNIKEISIPFTVKEIGNGAFSNCENVTTLKIASAVKKQELKEVFSGCVNLSEITSLGLISKIGKNMFSNCNKLESVIIPYTVSAISENAFLNCTNMSNIYIPNTVTFINGNAFNGCADNFTIICYENSIAHTFAIENNINYKFIDKYIAEGTLGDHIEWKINKYGVLKITGSGDMPEDSTFVPYSDQINTIVIDEGITSINNKAFYGFDKLLYVKLPTSLKVIGEYSFSGCQNLQEIITSEGLECINIYAFLGCRSLEKIFLSDSITNISPAAFNSCYRLTIQCIENSYAHTYAQENDIAFELLKAPIASGNCGENITWTLDEEGVLELTGTGDMPEENFFNDYAAQIKKVIVNEGITSVAINPGRYSTSWAIIEVVLPDSLIKISDYAFEMLQNLVTINLPENLTSIGKNAFYATGITNITIPSTVTSVGAYAFSNSKLETLYISEGVKEIPASSFRGCRTLKNITLPTSVTVIGEYGFAGAIVLESISIPANVTEIGERAFVDCEKLKTVNIPNKVTEISSEVFRNCKALTSISIPSTVTTIASSAFQNCQKLETVEISEGLTSIGNNAFLNCYNLKDVHIPKSVTSIGVDVFSDEYTAASNALKIYCYYGTAAARYASNNSLPYQYYSYQIAYHDNKNIIDEPIMQECYYNEELFHMSSVELLETISHLYGVTAEELYYGYEIDKWTTNANGSGTSYLIDESFKLSTGADSEIIHLYANWKPKEATINYYLNGGTNSLQNPEKYISSQGRLYLEEATREHYVFDGWYIDQSFTYGPVDSLDYYEIFNDFNGIIKLYAKWTPITYNISYDLNEGVYPDTLLNGYTVEDSVILPIPSKEHYEFKGWYTNSELTGDSLFELPVGSHGDLNLYAKWELVNYNVTYELNGGENSPENPTVFSGLDSITLNDPTKKGYVFRGWYDNSDFIGTSISVLSASNTGDIKLYAKWEFEKYSITYILNGGINPTSNPTDYTINDLITLENPTRDFYAFEGWFLNSDFAGETVNTIDKGSMGNIIFYAKWKPIEYTITYHLNGGQNHPNNTKISYTYEDNVQLYEPSRNGYAFSGWYEDEKCINNKVSTLPNHIVDDKELYAGWNIINYSISYDLSGGTNNSSNRSSYTVNDSFEFNEPSRNGYQFNGWTDSNGNIVTEVALGTTGNMSLLANWELINYPITYELNGGECNEELKESYTIVDSFQLLTPTKAGYTFQGWYTTNDFSGSKVYSVFSNQTGAKTFYAKWTANTYNIYYRSGSSGDIINSELNPSTFTPEDVGEGIILHAPTWKYRKFEGWYETSDFSGEPIEKITEYKNIWLYAKWSLDVERFIVELPSTDLIYTYTGTRWNNNVKLKVNPKIVSKDFDLSQFNDIKYSIYDLNDQAVISDKYFSNNTITLYLSDIKAGTYSLKLKIYDVYSKSTVYSEPVTFTITFERRIYPINENICLNVDKDNSKILNFSDVYDEIKALLIGEDIADKLHSEAGEVPSDGTIQIKDIHGNLIEDNTQLMSGTYTVIFELEEPGDTFLEKVETPLIISYETKGIKGTCGENISWNLDEEGTLTISGYGKMQYRYTFETYADKIKHVKMYGNITEISDKAFKNCNNLETIVFPNSLERIGHNSFENCSSLKAVHIPDTVSFLGVGAFKGCSAIESIVLPSNITTLNGFSFYDCTSLKEIVLPESLESIGVYEFCNCKELKEIIIPQNVSKIDNIAFEGCSNLENIVLPDGLEKIGIRVFQDCTSLTNIEIPKSVNFLGSWVFAGTGLTEIIIPDSITEIPDNAFRGCSELEYVYIPESVTQIGDGAFSSCTNLECLDIPSSVTTIGSNTLPFTNKDFFVYCEPDSAIYEYVQKSGGKIVETVKRENRDYYVVFDGNGANEGSVTQMTCNYVTVYTLPDNGFIKDGYVFNGWNTLADGSGISYEVSQEISQLTDIHKSVITLYAQWIPEEYLINYHLDNGTNDVTNPSVYTIETNTLKLANAQKDGYIFAGWYTDAEYTMTSKVISIKKGTFGNIDLYANWIQYSFGEMEQCLEIPFDESRNDWTFVKGHVTLTSNSTDSIAMKDKIILMLYKVENDEELFIESFENSYEYTIPSDGKYILKLEYDGVLCDTIEITAVNGKRSYPVEKEIVLQKIQYPNQVLKFVDIKAELENSLLNNIETKLKDGESTCEGTLTIKNSKGKIVTDTTKLVSGKYTLIYTLAENEFFHTEAIANVNITYSPIKFKGFKYILNESDEGLGRIASNIVALPINGVNNTSYGETINIIPVFTTPFGELSAEELKECTIDIIPIENKGMVQFDSSLENVIVVSGKKVGNTSISFKVILTDKENSNNKFTLTKSISKFSIVSGTKEAVKCIDEIALLSNTPMSKAAVQKLEPRFTAEDIPAYLFNAAELKTSASTYSLSVVAYNFSGDSYEGRLSDAKLKWSTSNSKIASVKVNSKTGEVVLTVKKGANGTANITAVANDPNKASYMFKIIVADSDMRLETTSLTMNSLSKEYGTIKLYTNTFGEILENVNYKVNLVDQKKVGKKISYSTSTLFETDDNGYNADTGELKVRFTNPYQKNGSSKLYLEITKYVNDIVVGEPVYKSISIKNKQVLPSTSLKVLNSYSSKTTKEASYATVLLTTAAGIPVNEESINVTSNEFNVIDKLTKISENQWIIKLDRNPNVTLKNGKTYTVRADVEYTEYYAPKTVSAKVKYNTAIPVMNVYGNGAYSLNVYPEIDLDETEVLISIPSGMSEETLNISLTSSSQKHFAIVGKPVIISNGISYNKKGKEIAIESAVLVRVKSISGKTGNVQFEVSAVGNLDTTIITKSYKITSGKIDSIALTLKNSANNQKQSSITFQEKYANTEFVVFNAAIPEALMHAYKMNHMDPMNHLLLRVEGVDSQTKTILSKEHLYIDNSDNEKITIKSSTELFAYSGAKLKIFVQAKNGRLFKDLKPVTITIKLQKKPLTITAKASVKGKLNVVDPTSKVSVSPTFKNLPSGTKVYARFADESDRMLYNIQNMDINSGKFELYKASGAHIPIAKDSITINYEIYLTNGVMIKVPAKISVNVVQSAVVKANITTIKLYNAALRSKYTKDVIFSVTKAGAAQIEDIVIEGLDGTGISYNVEEGTGSQKTVTFYANKDKARGIEKTYSVKAKVTLADSGLKKGQVVTYTLKLKINLNK